MSEKKMSKRTERKQLSYVKKEYVRTRTMPGAWYLSSYKFKFNITHMQPFLKKLKEKKVVGLECSGCNRVFFPPRQVCGKCFIKPDRWTDLRDTGRVATYTIVYVKDPETGETLERPVVCVQQDNSHTTHLVNLSPEVDFKDTYIGMPVKIHWAEERTGGLMDIEYYDKMEDKAKDLGLRKD
ncbi:MAG: Zn-ribbon domain-containing OB-fold protein [Promethearchaeota archaeon]